MSDNKSIFTPVEQMPRYKLVAQQIAELITSGQLAAESKMPTDRELVDQLGVSRTTVREAMIALEITGFIENRFGAGAYVSAMPPEAGALSEVSGPGPFELLEARMVVEGEIAYIASQLITKTQLRFLESCNNEMERVAKDVISGHKPDQAFHIQIARATENTALVSMVTEFWRERARLPMWVRMLGRIGDEERYRDQQLQEHKALVSALQAKDAQQAKDAMREHIASFGRHLLEKWKDLEENQKEDVEPPSDRLVRQLR